MFSPDSLALVILLGGNDNGKSFHAHGTYTGQRTGEEIEKQQDAESGTQKKG
jgi:hypothetical protein